MKKILVMLVLLIPLFVVSAKAEDGTGNVTFATFGYEKEDYEAVMKQQGTNGCINIYIEDKETRTPYELQLKPEEGIDGTYTGTFKLPAGEYSVIDKPDTNNSIYQIKYLYTDFVVHACTDDSSDLVSLFIQKPNETIPHKDKPEGTPEITEEPTETVPPNYVQEKKAEVIKEEPEKKSLPFGTWVTIGVVIVIIGLIFYKKVIRG